MDETLIGIFFSISNPFETKITNLIFAIYTYIRSLYLEPREKKIASILDYFPPEKKSGRRDTRKKKIHVQLTARRHLQKFVESVDTLCIR